MFESKPILLFPHIAKTAGVSAVTLLTRAFRGHTFGAYFQENVSGTGAIDLDDIARKFHELPDEERANVRFIPSHMQFGLHTRLRAECKYITFVRDPVDRMISTYNYTRSLGWLDAKYSFEDFVAMGFLGSNNNMVRTLSGDTTLDTMEKPALQNAVRPVTEEDYQRTIANIEEHFVSCIPVSSFDMGLIDFFRRWELPAAGMLYVRRNVTEGKQVWKDELPAATLDTIRELNAFDLRLYEYACDRFDAQYQARKAQYDAAYEKFSDFQEIYRKLSEALAEMQTRRLTKNNATLIQRAYRKLGAYPVLGGNGSSDAKLAKAIADLEATIKQIGKLVNTTIDLQF